VEEELEEFWNEKWSMLRWDMNYIKTMH
jgi:hypothetical protein